MKLSALKKQLQEVAEIKIKLPNGNFIPQHFHITEVGIIDKNFIDCGGTIRNEKLINFQIWEANDFEHRLTPKKLLSIIAQSEKVIGNDDYEVEVEYQQETIGKFGLAFNGFEFVLNNKQANCLASDHCGIPAEKLEKPRIKISELSAQSACCSPGGGCC